MTTKTTSQRPTKNILSVNAEQNPKNGHATKDGYKNQIMTLQLRNKLKSIISQNSISQYLKALGLKGPKIASKSDFLHVEVNLCFFGFFFGFTLTQKIYSSGAFWDVSNKNMKNVMDIVLLHVKMQPQRIKSVS